MKALGKSAPEHKCDISCKDNKEEIYCCGKAQENLFDLMDHNWDGRRKKP